MIKTLKLGNPSTNEGEFSISGKIITLNTALASSNVRVYYKHLQNVTNAQMKSGALKTYKISALMQLKDVKRGDIVYAQLTANNAQVQPSYSLILQNTADVPDTVPLTVDLLDDPLNKGVPFEMDIVKIIKVK